MMPLITTTTTATAMAMVLLIGLLGFALDALARGLHQRWVHGGSQ